MIKNVKFSGYCFHVKANVKRDFQICMSVSLDCLIKPESLAKFLVIMFQ